MQTSNNATSAENQQERLVNLGWVLGFVDGEGCFSINFIKQADRQESERIRRGYKLGLQVAHEFAVTQGESSKPSLIKLKKFFGVGEIYINKRYDNHKEHLFRYTVRKKVDLLNVIIPFFEKHMLRTNKYKNFKLFAKCVNMINRKEHLTQNGLLKILKISESMNHKKPKTNLIRILRNHTPNPKLVAGATSRREDRVRSV